MSSVELEPIVENTMFMRIKEHVKKHQVVYSAVAGSVVTSTVFVLTRSFVGSVNIAPVFNNVGPQVNFGGPMTKLVQCLETGEIWATVTEAADAAGVTLSYMSRHLNGHKEHLYGKHYKILGMGVA